jgi:peptidyl-prolyl cis-trans isomerase D
MIIIVFIFWGFGVSLTGNNRPDVVASIDGQTISVKEVQRAYENLVSLYRETYKDRLTPEMLEAFNLKQQALDQIIAARLFEAEARRLGFSVDDDELRQSIATLSIFQDGGQFSHEQYVRALRYLRMTPGEFEDAQRGELLRKKLQNLITDAVPVTDEELQELFRYSNEKVTLSFVRIASADLLSKITIERKEVEDYYNTHRESFRQPERVRFAYIAYPASQFESQVQVSSQEIEEFYSQEQTARFTLPPRVHARHILFALSSEASEEDRNKARATATEVLTRARSGEDFATLAKTYSQDTATAPNGGDLGFFSRGRMVKPFEEAAFNLSAGGISELVETPFGLHIIKAEAVEPERVRPLTEVQEEIRQELMRTRARDLAQARAQEDSGKIRSGTPLTEVAQAAGLTVTETPPIGRDESIPEIGRQPQLISAAFTLALNQVSDAIAAGDTWYLVVPREKTEARIPELAEVAEEAEKRCKSDKAEQQAKAKADAVLARVKETKDLSAVATQEGLTVEETTAFTRQGGYIPQIGNLPDLKKAAFRLTPEAPVIAQSYLWGGNAFIVVLKEQISASPQDFDKQKDTIRKELLQRKQADALEAFVRSLKKRATIMTNPDAIGQLAS